MRNKFDMREVNSLRSIDEISSRLYDSNCTSKYANKDGLLDQYHSIKGTCGIIFALVSGSDGNPKIEQFVAYK
jgi:hypothetical protein